MLQQSAANNDRAAKVDNEARQSFDQAPSAHLGCCMFGCIKTIQISYGLMTGSHGEGERNSGSARLSAKSRAGLSDSLERSEYDLVERSYCMFRYFSILPDSSSIPVFIL